MLHLLGLRLWGEIESVVTALERMRLLVRGIGGEGSEAAGQIYQVSNMDTLGTDEAGIIRRVMRICTEIVRQEYNARVRLLQESPLILADCLARSLSILERASAGHGWRWNFSRRCALRRGDEVVHAPESGGRGSRDLMMQPGHLRRDWARKCPPQT